MTKLLLVEDDTSIVKNLSEFLSKEGFSVSSATGQSEALQRLMSDLFDLVLLDVSLLDGNGFSLCAMIKSEYRLPVIFLTASDDEYSTVTGFTLGADDYIAKPFRPRELVMRIKNVLRLTSGRGRAIRLGAIEVDTEKGRATKNGKDVFLSALEYRLLLIFINNRGTLLTRARLLDSIWDMAGEYVSDNTLTVYVKRLREKLEDDPTNPVLIKTVRGIGYRMD